MAEPIREPKVHRFSSTAEAYDASQTDEEISNGDVLVVEDEGVIGILVEAWPVAIIVDARGDAGEFHLPVATFDWSDVVQCPWKDDSPRLDYTASVELAREARR